MPANAPLPVPTAPLLQWVLANPEAAAEIVRTVNLLVGLEVVFTTPNATRGRDALVKSALNYQLSLPLKYPGGVPSRLSTAATLAEVITAVNALIDGERQIQVAG